LEIIPLDFSYRFVGRLPTEREFVRVLTDFSADITTTQAYDVDITSQKRLLNARFSQKRSQGIYSIAWLLPTPAEVNSDDPERIALQSTIQNFVTGSFSNAMIPVYEFRHSRDLIDAKVAESTRNIEPQITEGFGDEEVEKMLESISFMTYPSYVEPAGVAAAPKSSRPQTAKFRDIWLENDGWVRSA
jgi:hypothetical protein